MSPIPRRFLQASAVVLTMLLAAEGLLQAGALVVRAGTRVVPKSWITGSTRVLALGDSNTFGIYLEPEEAYPAQLERLWNQAYPEHPIEVLNLGYPGTNSFRILDNIDAMMRKLRPDVVLLTVGVNDFLTPVEEIAAADALFTRLRRAVTRHSRLHRFVHLLRRNQEGPVEVGIERRKWEWTDDPQASLSQVHRFQAANAGRGAEQVFRVGGEEFVASKGGEAAGEALHLEENLGRIAEVVEGYAAGLYLLTYGAAASFYELSNRATIAAAEQHSLDLIDVSAELGQRCPILSRCSSFFFGDLHPTAMGYEVIAESIMERLADDWGLPR